MADADPDAARPEIARLLAEWSRRGVHIQHIVLLFYHVELDLFSGHIRRGHDNLAAAWPEIQGGLLYRIEHARVFMCGLRARVALAAAIDAAATGRDPARYLREARRVTRTLAGERAAWAGAFAALLRAQLRALSGDRRGAAEHCRDAIARFDQRDMALYAMSARRWLATLVGGDEGRALADRADTWMTDQTVRDPLRMASVPVPALRHAVSGGGFAATR
jgi:hypothetical protein